MKKAKLFAIFLIIVLVLTQFSLVSAAPSNDVADSLSGTVLKIELSTDPSSGESTVWVTVLDNQDQEQNVQVSLETALEWHLVMYENDELVPNESLLNTEIDIPLSAVDPGQTDDIKHPVASALATFFSEDVPGVNYNLIMRYHDDGFGFGVIAQALWMTKKLDGDLALLQEVFNAKETGDYTYFAQEDGSVPTSWGQLRKLVMDGDKKGNLGAAMSDKDKDNNGNGANHSNNSSNGNNGDKGNNGNHGNASDKGNNGNKDNNTNNGNKQRP